MPITIGTLGERALDDSCSGLRRAGIGLIALLLAGGVLASCGGVPEETRSAPTTNAAAGVAVTTSDEATAPRLTGTLTIRGALAHRARIALPKQALAIVELRGESGADGAVVAEQRIEMNGKQVPVAFELIVDRSTLTGKPPYQIRGGIVVAGRPEWSTALVVIDETVDSVDLGTLLMNPARTGTVTATLRATGNEPGWRLELGAAVLSFATADGNRSIDARTPLPRVVAPDQRRYAARIGSRDMVIDVTERVCVDTMTGMPHPQAVRIRFNGKTYSGCGGNPATLLQGTEWRVQDIDGALVPRSRATLSFADEGRVTGRASCNAFGAEYSLTGERLLISRAAATMMACDAPLMQQEQRFMDLLQQTERFEITADGALVLHSAGQRSITARRGL